VLGTPPAFVLSQDQTLHYREPIAQILLASRRSEERASRLIWHCLISKLCAGRFARPLLLLTFCCSVFKVQ
ncbi:hypothetical protein, partial [Planococcus chinensis]|uniref:hypothetical protein n=1 Tax=Planococcus chinensis TaxID=272917 RepID=UPI001CC3F935